MINYLPYTNFQDTNLDWMMGQVKQIPDMINNAVGNAFNHAVFTASYDPETQTIILRSEVEYSE